MLTLERFKEARSVLQGVLRPTPLIHSPSLSKGCGNTVYLKPENMQVTGAYKIRGAYYKISTLSLAEKERGLVTASAGNHAQGVAYAAQVVAENNGNIIKLEHNQFVNINRQSGVELRVTLEAFGHEHKKQILNAL